MPLVFPCDANFSFFRTPLLLSTSIPGAGLREESRFDGDFFCLRILVFPRQSFEVFREV